MGKLSVLGNNVQDGESSSTNPVEIKCVGSTKKNLFSLDKKITGKMISNDEIVAAEGYNSGYFLCYVELEKDEDYVMSFELASGYENSFKLKWAYSDVLPEIGQVIEDDMNGDGCVGEFIGKVFTGKKKYLLLQFFEDLFIEPVVMWNIQVEKGKVATPYVPYGMGSTEVKIENADKTQSKSYTLPIQKEMLKGDYFLKEADGWKEVHNWVKIDSYNGESINTDYVSTTGALTTGATVFYKINTPTKLACTNEQVEILEQLNNLELFTGTNYITTVEGIAILKLKYQANDTEIDEIRADIEDLQESQVSQNSDIEALMNALPSETVEGETVNIKGTIPVKFKEFVVGGNNKQESRSGKNKLLLRQVNTSINGLTIATVGNKITINGTATIRN